MQLMRMTEDGPLQPTPLWHRADLEGPALVREFLRESRIVRKGLDGSLAKVSMQTVSYPMLFAYGMPCYTLHSSTRLNTPNHWQSISLQPTLHLSMHRPSP